MWHAYLESFTYEVSYWQNWHDFVYRRMDRQDETNILTKRMVLVLVVAIILFLFFNWCTIESM